MSFTVKNTGGRAGAEIAEVYVALPASAGEPPKRLAGWSKLQLNPGESREVSSPINPRELSIYDEGTNKWKQLPGRYTFMVGGSSKDYPSTRSSACPKGEQQVPPLRFAPVDRRSHGP